MSLRHSLSFVMPACRAVNERNAFLIGNKWPQLWEPWEELSHDNVFSTICGPLTWYVSSGQLVVFLFKTYRKVERIAQWMLCTLCNPSPPHTHLYPTHFLTFAFACLWTCEDDSWFDSYLSFFWWGGVWGRAVEEP